MKKYIHSGNPTPTLAPLIILKTSFPTTCLVDRCSRVNKHHCHLPEMNWCFTVQQTYPPNKDIPFMSLQFHHPKKPTTQTNNYHRNNFFGDKFAQNPNQNQNSAIPTKNQPTLGSSYSRQPPSKTNICRGVSFRSVASQDPARWRRGQAWVGWLFRWFVLKVEILNCIGILIYMDKIMVLSWNSCVFL